MASRCFGPRYHTMMDSAVLQLGFGSIVVAVSDGNYTLSYQKALALLIGACLLAG